MAGRGGKVDRPDMFMCPSCALGTLKHQKTFVTGTTKYRTRKCNLCHDRYLEKSELILKPIPPDYDAKKDEV